MLCLRQLLFMGLLPLSHVGAYDLRKVLPLSTPAQKSGPVPTAPAATPARTNSNIGVWTSTALQEIIKERDEHAARGHLAEIEQRDQFIFALCPESWKGGVPKACSECGNDTIVPGQCDQIMFTGSQERCQFSGGCGVYCQCVPGAVDITPGKVTSITTVSGQAGTVVYEALTLAEYSGLKASTTVTITDLVATSTDSSADMETFVAVVVAGGIAWWVAEQFGAAAAIAAIQPPSELPDGGEEDDQVCQKDPKEDCADCGGANSVKLCSSGAEVGCPCDENQKCPDEPPRCTDASCGGDNGQSQCSATGAINGCTCCPSTTISCSDNNCNGDDFSQCQAETYHGCGCLWLGNDGTDVDIENDDPGAITPDQLSSLVAAVFTTAWGAMSSSVPGLLQDPTVVSCPYASYTPTTSLNTGTASVTFLPVTNCYCNCGPTMTPQYWGTNSDHSTTSWCMQGTTAPGDYTFVSQGCEPSAATIPTTALATTTTAPAPVKTPPPNTTCNKNSDCSQYTCTGGSAATCVAGAAGDPFTSLCQC
ncbi:hypothetical protein F5882DRAFT_522552 [Hyaloscypha sp. PMI_1271]|nr:hypothetical protein F5882DRAFT_522552 [Hyaloscypha sp. PMI_1271]